MGTMAAPPAGHGGAVERALSGAIAAPSRELRSVGSHGSAALRPLGAIAGAPLHFQRAAETGPHPGDAVDGRRTKRARALEEGGLPGDIAFLQECGQSGWRSRDMGASECLLRRAAGCDDRSAGSPRARKRIKRAWGVSLAVPSETPPAEVIAGRLYIGSRAQAQNWALLQGLGITHIVNVSRESCEPFAGRVAYHQCGIPDTDEADLTGPCASSRRFIDAAFAADAGARVLVHCASGVSRSVAVAMHYLSCTHTGLGCEGALAHIRAVHPAAQPNRGFVTQLREMESRRREAACEGGESCGGGESFGGGACGGGEDGGEGLVGRSESCASIARTESSGSVAVGGEAGLSRVSSWARVASTEDVGWISRCTHTHAHTHTHARTHTHTPAHTSTHAHTQTHKHSIKRSAGFPGRHTPLPRRAGG